MLIVVPAEETEIFWQYFECEWHKQANDNWAYWHTKQVELEKILIETGYDSAACFLMLCRSHDIIYNREEE